MIRRTVETKLTGLCVALAIAGAIGGVYCYGRADDHGHGHDYHVMETFGTYSGLCFDAAIFAGLAALLFAVRKRSGWPATGLFISGGSLMVISVGPIPRLVLEQSLENDMEPYLAMASSVCIVLAAVGAIMIASSVIQALMAGQRRCTRSIPPMADPDDAVYSGQKQTSYAYRRCLNCGARNASTRTHCVFCGRVLG
jgi:hypothetical protein